jgi:hypothetical protein
MTEFFAMGLGFAAGWSTFLLSAFIIFGIIAEHNDSSGWAVFWLILSAMVAWTMFSVSLVNLLLGAAAYLIIGILWCFWRYKRKVSKTIEDYKDRDQVSKDYALRAIHPQHMLNTFTAWVFVWPFSMVENFIGDIISFVQTLIRDTFRKVYYKIYESAEKSLKSQ